MTIDHNKIRNVANTLGEPLYILREIDGRFENEDLPIQDIKEKAVATITNA